MSCYGSAKTLRWEDTISLPGFADILGANQRGELHEIGPGMILRGKWELLALLGEGSFGRVYEARHVKLGYQVAIKVLVGERAGPWARRRFLEEAQLMAGLSSEGLIKASDYDELEDGTPYFVMDLVKGKSLRHLLRERLTVWRAVDIGEQILAGLVEIHRHGVVHGDIKPENVVIGESDEKARLLDFGLARTSAEEPAGLGGTPCYMAPEMLLHKGYATVHTDVYAAGVVIYEMLTGRLPRGHLRMDAAKIREEWKLRRRADPVLMHCRQVPEARRGVLEALDKLVMDALAANPVLRPKSALAMLEEIGALRRQLSSNTVASTLVSEKVRSCGLAYTEANAIIPFTETKGPGRMRWALAVGVAGLVGVGGWWALSASSVVSMVSRGDTESQPPRFNAGATGKSLKTEDIEPASKGILVAVRENASESMVAGYKKLCDSLGGGRVLDGSLPVFCQKIPSVETDVLMTLAEQAGVRGVVLVGDGDRERIMVRSTKHHRGNALLAQLDGLEIPKEPEAVELVASVLRAVVGARAAAGGTGATEAEIPAFNWEIVGARWAVLAQWLRVQQGHETPGDVRQRKAIAQALEDEVMAERGESDGAAFYRDLAMLILATSQSCAGVERMLSELSEVGERVPGIQGAALLERASCLLSENDAKSKVEEAESILAEAFTASGGHDCVKVDAIGLVSQIDTLRGSNAGWEALREQLPGMQRCEPGIWSRGYAVRGDALVERGDWCGAAEAYGLAYEALESNVNALVAWPEYAWKCSKAIAGERRELSSVLGEALDSQRFVQAKQRVSIAYMRWWLSRESTDAKRVLEEYANVEDGDLAMLEGTASDLETEICERTKGDACSLRLLARPKRAGEAALLRRSLGLL